MIYNCKGFKYKHHGESISLSIYRIKSDGPVMDGLCCVTRFKRDGFRPLSSSEPIGLSRKVFAALYDFYQR